MSEPLRLGVIGDFDPGKHSHTATNEALRHAAGLLQLQLDTKWIPTNLTLRGGADLLDEFDGFLCAPGSPYHCRDGALYAIRFARENKRPLLGTCGGCQHMVIEYARSVLGIRDAAHAEEEPASANKFVVPQASSLAGKGENIGIVAGSMAARLYGRTTSYEEYRCNFEIDPRRQGAIHQSGFHVVGHDDQRKARIFELPGHPYYVATLFAPQMVSRQDQPHPLIVALLQATQIVSGAK